MTAEETYDFFRCPRCGGLNENDAEWCGQCFARFQPRPSEPKTDDRPQGPSPYVQALAGVLGVDDDRSPEAIERIFDPDRGAVWICPGCGLANPTTTDSCSECGLTFRQAARATVDEVKAEQKAEGEALASDLSTGALAAVRAGPLALPLAAVAIGVAALKALVRRAVRRSAATGRARR